YSDAMSLPALSRQRFMDFRTVELSIPEVLRLPKRAARTCGVGKFQVGRVCGTDNGRGPFLLVMLAASGPPNQLAKIVPAPL
ncbi:MAG: hypothetical protein VYC80_18155, partial [Planctomycetota bacterium]|nr:hypothetical protein [Planctomycetota bacterium]